MFAKLYSAGIFGMEAFTVEVEADLSKSFPGFEIVGLPDTAVKESKERVRSALLNTGFEFPVKRITINLAPADIKKAGPIYDMPVFLAVAIASEQLSVDTEGCAFLGELSLSGEVRPARGLIAMAAKAKESGIKKFFVPADNAAEAAVVGGIEVYPVRSIKELIDHLTGACLITPAVFEGFTPPEAGDFLDFADVCGQSSARRAMEIAAAGGHNLLLIGPPGSGKSMLAKRLPSILPDMTFNESVDTTKIHSIAGTLPDKASLIKVRPFRSPHHTVSPAGLSGGGAFPRPGEISLAHNGVLFLDELPEFDRPSLEVLRQPLEDGVVNISRVAGTLSYPSSIMLVAAMNPCPCGFYGSDTKPCICGKGAVSRYLNRVSGPLLDRLDLHVEVPPVDFDSLSGSQKGECSADIKRRVTAARDIQRGRYAAAGSSIQCNARITTSILSEVCPLTDGAKTILKQAFDSLGMSARGYDRVLKVARTVADLDGAEVIDIHHIAEAVQFRSLDRKYWQGEI